MKKFKPYAVFALKMLTMPIGTTFEFYGQRVNRVTYTVNLLKSVRKIRGRW